MFHQQTACARAGNSIFFSVRKIEDPIGLLPPKLILGINKRGVHFFRPVPKEYLHSAELRDIMQFGSSSQAVFFKMRVAGGDLSQIYAKSPLCVNSIIMGEVRTGCREKLCKLVSLVRMLERKESENL